MAKDNFTTDDFGRGLYKGQVIDMESVRRWDKYFHSICEAVASKSPCLSRKIGAILVRDNIVVSTGYNGPARGIPPCGHERLTKDKALSEALIDIVKDVPKSTIMERCPRKLMGYFSGEGMEWCPAAHAEANCIVSAARLGVSVKDATLYMNSIAPCKNCLTLLINAGVTNVVVDEVKMYDKHSSYIIENSNLIIREFILEDKK